MDVPPRCLLYTEPITYLGQTILSTTQSGQLTFESRQLIQATFRLILLCGESGPCDGPGPDVDAGDSSEGGVGAIGLDDAKV